MQDEALELAATRVLAEFPLAGPLQTECLGNAGGFSGSCIWKVHSPGHDCCLKAWPPGHTTDEQLTKIHGWMTIARRGGLDFVPTVYRTHAGRSFVNAQDRHWDLTEWMPGQADLGLTASRAQVEAAMAALARLHRVWAGESLMGIPTSVKRRLEAVTEWRRLVQSGWRPDFSRPNLATVADLARAAWESLARLTPHVERTLAGWQRAGRLQPCLCDVWAEHVLFEGQRVSGIIDYASMRLDHPAADLARLLGSITTIDVDLYAAGLNAYRWLNPLPEAEIGLVHALEITGTILGAANWLRWLYVEERRYDDLRSVRRRMQMLIDRLARL